MEDSYQHVFRAFLSVLHKINNNNELSERDKHLFDFFANSKLPDNTYSVNCLNAIKFYTELLDNVRIDLNKNYKDIKLNYYFSSAWGCLKKHLGEDYSDWKYHKNTYWYDNTEYVFLDNSPLTMKQFEKVPHTILLHAMLRAEYLKYYNTI